MRILVVGHTYIVPINQGKLQSLAKMGIEIGLLVPESWHNREWNKTFIHTETFPTDISYFPSKVFFNGRNGAYFYNPVSLCKIIQVFSPDIIHVEQEVFSISSFQLAVVGCFLHKPITLFCWENVDRDLPLLRRFTRDYVLDRVQAIVAGNQGAKDLLRKWKYTGHIEIFPQLGVDPPNSSSSPRELKKDTCIIGYFGRIVHEKGIDLLLKATEKLISNGIKVSLLIIGSGNQLEELRDLSNQLGISNYVTWKSAIAHERVLTEMDKIDILVLPSRSIENWKEQFGHVLVEAMSLAIPVVGSDCGEIPNVIGREDLIFLENNSDDLMLKLQKLGTDKDFYTEISRYCLERVKNCFTNDVIAKKLIYFWDNHVFKRSSGYVNQE